MSDAAEECVTDLKATRGYIHKVTQGIANGSVPAESFVLPADFGLEEHFGQAGEAMLVIGARNPTEKQRRLASRFWADIQLFRKYILKKTDLDPVGELGNLNKKRPPM